MYQIVPIKGFPDYFVTTQGEIFSKRKGYFTELRGGYGHNGYRQVELRNEKIVKKYLVHRLVAEAFVPGKGETVDHIDNNKDNNCADNLRWMPLMANIRRKNKSGLPIGVSKRLGKYYAMRKIKGKYYYSSSFDTVEEASSWYQNCTGEGQPYVGQNTLN